MRKINQLNLVKLDCGTLSMLVALMMTSSITIADEKEELLKLRNTTLNLINLLVDQGILDKQKASEMIKEAEKKAVLEAKEAVENQKLTQGITQKKSDTEAIATGTVRVTYVPDFVKEEIRADVRKELKEEVVKEVKAEAKTEKWGIPAALPEWVSRIKPSGDIRLRYEGDFFGDGNTKNSYYNWPYINSRGGIANVNDPYRNTTIDRNRFRMRLRLGFDAKVADGLNASVRMTTSNDRSPISINQTLGQYGQEYEIVLDRAFLQYDYLDTSHHDWATLWVGRLPNPWFSSDNLFDPDLGFEGVAGTFRFPFNQDDPYVKAYEVPNTTRIQQVNMGYTKPNQAYLTLGFFPLQEIQLSSHDKWMWGAQTGVDWLFSSDSQVKFGLAYYDYNNTQAIPNPLGSIQNDWTAPQFFTQGNSLARISNDGNPSIEPRLVGLASRFQVFDAIASYDYTGFSPHHIKLTANYSHNFGFNSSQISKQFGQNISPETDAFQVRLDVGQLVINQLHDWNVWFAYKHLDRDSVLDAFTDSNFHLSGTNAKGWMFSANYGLAHNTWINLRWLSSSVITGPTYDVDVLLADLNARF